MLESAYEKARRLSEEIPERYSKMPPEMVKHDIMGHYVKVTKNGMSHVWGTRGIEHNIASGGDGLIGDTLAYTPVDHPLTLEEFNHLTDNWHKNI